MEKKSSDNFLIKKETSKIDIILDPYTSKPMKNKFLGQATRSFSSKQRKTTKKKNKGLLQLSKSKTNSELFQDLRLNIKRRRASPLEKTLKPLSKAMRNQIALSKINTDPGNSKNRVDFCLPGDYKLPKMRNNFRRNSKKNDHFKIATSNRDKINREMIKLNFSNFDDELMKHPLVRKCEIKFLKHKNDEDNKSKSMVVNQGKNEKFDIFKSERDNELYRKHFQKKTTKVWKARRKNIKIKNSKILKTFGKTKTIDEKNKPKSGKNKFKKRSNKKSLSTRPKQILKLGKKNTLKKQKTEKFKEKKTSKVNLPKVNNKPDIRSKKKEAWKDKLKNFSKRGTKKKRSRKFINSNDNYRLRSYFSKLETEVEINDSKKRGISKIKMFHQTQKVEIQSLKLKRDKYFLCELEKCYNNLKQFCDLTKYHELFKHHFEETVKIFKTVNRYKPVSDVELADKFLDDNTINDLELLSLKHQNKILILDLDETLIHARYVLSEKDSTFKLFLKPNGPEVNVNLSIRPGVQTFLEDVMKFYTLVLWTASTQDYADKILEYIDPDRKYFKFRLYRDSCVKTKNRKLTKDLRIFQGLKLEKILLVDNASYNFANQIHNGIPIISFHGEMQEDNELDKLTDYLQMLAKEDNLALHNSRQFKFNSLIGVKNYLQAYESVLDGYY